MPRPDVPSLSSDRTAFVTIAFLSSVFAVPSLGLGRTLRTDGPLPTTGKKVRCKTPNGSPQYPESLVRQSIRTLPVQLPSAPSAAENPRTPVHSATKAATGLLATGLDVSNFGMSVRIAH